MEDARSAGLSGKDVWKAYPASMMRARVVSMGIRMICPGIVAGLYTPEEVADMRTIEVEARPAPEHHAVNHDNQTGHGSGAYAKPDVLEAYSGFIKSMYEEVNQKWLDRITGPGGEMISDKAEVVTTYGISGHLLKWAKAQGWVKAPDDMRPGQRDKFAAVAWPDHMGEYLDEARAYCKREWNKELRKAEAKAKPLMRRENLPLPDDDRDVPDPDELLTTEAGARG
jgi:hypothetical protein